MIRVIKVTGNSLSPFFLSGDFVIVRGRSGSLHKIKKGEILVVNHHALGLIIKRVRDNDPIEKFFTLEGTHPDSDSPEKIGPIPYQDVIGKVILHFKNPLHQT